MGAAILVDLQPQLDHLTNSSKWVQVHTADTASLNNCSSTVCVHGALTSLIQVRTEDSKGVVVYGNIGVTYIKLIVVDYKSYIYYIISIGN